MLIGGFGIPWLGRRNKFLAGSVWSGMNSSQSGEPAPQKPLRLWPGVVAVALLWLVRYGLPYIAPETIVVGVIGELVGGLAVIVWWAFFSRAPLLERWGALVLMILAQVVTYRLIDKSIATGMMGFMFAVFSIPTLCLAFVAWAVLTRNLSDGPRRISLVATILLACGGWTLLRTGGINGDAKADFAWRWTKTHEERLVAHVGGPIAAVPAAPVPAKIPVEAVLERHVQDRPAAKSDVNWPGFRGPGRDSIIPGIRIKTDWTASPPVELWRRPVGPGWSSFAVRGNLFYTQEQRGDEEIVSCYNAATGNPVWAHRDAARFWEANAGAGPRATPTISEGHLYTFGATGILNALDAGTGAVIWSRNAASDTGTKVPGWGFSSSPLVVGGSVIIAASGKLAAYDAATGAPRWVGPDSGGGYSSPHLTMIDGVAQIVLLTNRGATSVAPADGSLLWKYPWPTDTRIVQPAGMTDGSILISGGGGGGGPTGMRRVAILQGPAGWTTEDKWTSAGLKPYFNDFVVYDGHVFGFDGGILACIDATDGKRKWKGGRYGHGQLVLLRDQGLLLVLSEEGDIALVKAATDQFTELARRAAIEGKTWNHPVLAGDRLLVRNDSEMVAFRLVLASN